MSEKGFEIHTGMTPGRLVWGHPMKSQTKKYQDGAQKGQPVMKDGQPVQQWAFGVAFPKQYFQENIWPHMAAEAATGYPNGVPPRFSWKYQDGDGIDSHGKSFTEREGYAGCYVLTVSTEFKCPECWKSNGAGGYIQLKPEEMKTGDWIALALNLKVNVATGTNTPSLYVNPLAIELVGQGTEIISSGSVDPVQALGGRTYALPPGATPLGTAPPMAAPGAGMPGTSGTPPMAPAQPMQPAPPPPPPPAPPVGPQRPADPSHIANAGTPHEQWWINGAWTPAPQPGTMPPPAHDFVAAAGVAPAMQPQPGYPGGMPTMPGR